VDAGGIGGADEQVSIRPEETELSGRWIKTDGRVIGDAIEKRIADLIASELEKVATSSSGWEVLYRDPADGRYWELSYPHGDWHGGGPKRLAVISVDDAHQKFRLEETSN
jgi:hypothetical protein